MLGLSRQDAFDQIYARRGWGEGPSRSGGGSSPEVARPYVDFVCRIILEHEVRSVVDIGHGDWVMWPEHAFSETTYLGLDVATDLSVQVSRIHGTDRRTFRHADAVTEDLPAADLLVCKDVLQHLPDHDVAAVLRKLRRYRLSIVSHDVHAVPINMSERAVMARQQVAMRSRLSALAHGENPLGRRQWRPPENVDIAAAECRPLNLDAPPWSLESGFGLRVLARHDFPATPGRWTGVAKRIWLLAPTPPQTVGL